MTIRILIVDDHSVVREGLRIFLGRDSELEIVDEAADGAEAIEKARRLRPDVVLMDLLIPVIDGISATSIIRRESPETRVIALTSVVDSALVTGSIRAGAVGYLLKDADANELRTVIKAVAAGQVQLSPQVSSYLLRELQEPVKPTTLTDREAQVLNLLAQGKSNKEIASYLQIAEDTVKSHIRHILTKLGVQSRTQAVILAIRQGLVASEARI